MYDALPDLNALGTVAVVAGGLGAALLLLGGSETTVYALALLGVAVTAVARAMHEDAADERDGADWAADDGDRRGDREKEVEAYEDGFA